MEKHYWKEILPKVLELKEQDHTHREIAEQAGIQQGSNQEIDRAIPYFSLTKDYGITPSMSRRRNCYDNAMAENFFGILKAECLRRDKPKTIQEAKLLIDNYIYFYNTERIQLKIKLTPLEKRRQLA